MCNSKFSLKRKIFPFVFLFSYTCREWCQKRESDSPSDTATEAASSQIRARRLAIPSPFWAEFARKFFCLTFMGPAEEQRPPWPSRKPFLLFCLYYHKNSRLLSSFVACFCRQGRNYAECFWHFWTVLHEWNGGRKNAEMAPLFIDVLLRFFCISLICVPL